MNKAATITLSSIKKQYQIILYISTIALIIGLVSQIYLYNSEFISNHRNTLKRESLQLASIVDNNLEFINSEFSIIAHKIATLNSLTEKPIEQILNTHTLPQHTQQLINSSSLVFLPANAIETISLVATNSPDLKQSNLFLTPNQDNPYKLSALYKVTNKSANTTGFIIAEIDPYLGYTVPESFDLSVALITKDHINIIHHSEKIDQNIINSPSENNDVYSTNLTNAKNLQFITHAPLDIIFLVISTFIPTLIICCALIVALCRTRKLFVEPILACVDYINKKINTEQLEKATAQINSETEMLFDHLHTKKETKQIEELNEEQRNLEQSLLDKNKYLEQELAARTTILNNASHEIRTPLQGVYNISQVLNSDWEKYDEAKKQEMIKAMADSAERLNNFVDSLLDLSKIDAGKMLFEHKLLPMSQIVTDVANEFINVQLPDNNIAISCHIEEGPVFNVIGDQDKLKQLVRNLLSNAIKFTKKGRVTVSLRKYKDSTMLICVKDEGVGIPADEIDNIFEPFVQSSLTKHISGGTGLGLALCKEIVDGHKGKIWAENNAGLGASFNFILPMNKEATATELPTTNNIESSTSSNSEEEISNKYPIKLLMIDDEEICHYSTKVILGMQSNITMISAYSADEGFDIIKANKDIDLILLDMMMPGTDGLEMLKIIRNDTQMKHLNVIIQSGVANPQQIQHAITMGADGFATKPTSHKIINQIYDTINKKRNSGKD